MPKKYDNAPFEDGNFNLKQMYKNTFTSDEGRVVLLHMLSEQGFFDIGIENPGEVELRNYAVRLLGILGLDGQVGQEIFLDTLIKNLTSVSEKKQEPVTEKIGIDDTPSPFRRKNGP